MKYSADSAQITEIYSLIFWQKFRKSLQKSWFHRKKIRWDMRVLRNCVVLPRSLGPTFWLATASFSAFLFSMKSNNT